MIISRDRHNPQKYRCRNFAMCDVSSSHDPEYVGWVPANAGWFHSDACARQFYARLAADRMPLD